MMRRTYVLAALALATLLPACGELSRTEIMVVVEADEGVQLDASSLRFQVWGRRSDVPLFGDPLFDDRFESIAFPRRFGVVPDGNDASRFIRVQATAVDATGAAMPFTMNINAGGEDIPSNGLTILSGNATQTLTAVTADNPSGTNAITVEYLIVA